MSSVEAIAEWAVSVGPGDIPDTVDELARAQRRSVLGSIAASSGAPSSSWRRILDAIASWCDDGPAPLVATGRQVSVDDALYAASSASMALDFDDYVCFGHSGHSAVLVPVLLAAETHSSGREQLTAQIVANEVAGRLGAACLIGPQNGQMWTFIHAAGAALSAGRLIGLDRHQMAHALAIALSMPARVSVPGFMAPDTKLLGAAEPSTAGLRAARLAAAGVSGPLDVLDRDDGFFAAFADVPLRRFLGGLGQGWVTHTLSVKIYPGCAYLDTMLDALHDLDLGPLPGDAIRSVAVEATALTTAMDGLSAPSLDASGPSPVTVSFSVPWTAAAALVAGELTPRQFDDAWLTEHHQELSSVASRVSLRHGWRLTKTTVSAFRALLPLRPVMADIGIVGLCRAVGRARIHACGRSTLFEPSRMDWSRLTSSRWHASQSVWRAPSRVPRASARRARQARLHVGEVWAPDALAELTMAFPARVRVDLADGRQVAACSVVARGAAGHPTYGPHQAARDKLAMWGPMLWATSTGAIDAAIERDADQLFELLGARAQDSPATGSAHVR